MWIACKAEYEKRNQKKPIEKWVYGKAMDTKKWNFQQITKNMLHVSYLGCDTCQDF